jgi:hypothetical protein
MKSLGELQQVLHACGDELRNRYKAKGLAVFGSYARGEQTENSDLNILVEYSEPVSLFHVVDTELFLTDALGVKVDLVLKRSAHSEI